MEQIQISNTVSKPVDQVWEFYTKPDHIMRWNYASLDWHTTQSENDLRPGGKFSSRMEAKDGSFGFDFWGIYDEIITNKIIRYTMGDGRKATVNFIPDGNRQTRIQLFFDPESENPIEMQKLGWQAILDNFKAYVENTQKVIPYLWYDKNALEATEFYISIFPDSKLIGVEKIYETPSGDCDMISFQLLGLEIQAIGAGPEFQFNSSLSFMVTCTSKEELNEFYKKLSENGKILMPLGEYPFSPYYVWFSDKYGLNWQLILMDKVVNRETNQRIRPVLLFQGEQCGKALDALNFYQSVLPGANIGQISRYLNGEAKDARAIINYAPLSFLGMDFVVMDHGYGGDDTFNESFSLMIRCKDQMEINYYWNKLSFVPEAEQCGWLKDRFGVSWQIVPSMLGDIFANATPEEVKRVTKAFLKMGKFYIDELEKAKKG